MPHWKIILTYDGTSFNGWQIQPSLPTVQGTLAQAIHHITGESVLPQGSGRTDTGVHALAQVASFSLTVPIPSANLHRALNRSLPSSIRVLSVEETAEDFHARRSVLRKTYEYRISTAPICSPMLAPYVWSYPHPLDLAAMQNAADHVIGTHDFTSFSASDPDLSTRTAPDPAATDPAATDRPIKEVVISTAGGAFAAAAEQPASPRTNLRSPYRAVANPSDKTFTRTINESTWRRNEDLLIYRVTGSGFLHHMVRNLVGTFVEAGIDRIPADSVPAILAARNRSAAGPTAPARGLFLVEVVY